MPIAEITQGLASLKVAIDIAKGLQATNTALEQATLKVQIADLMGALADAKIALVDSRDRFAEKEREIARLTDALQSKANVVRKRDAYYETDDNGNPRGAPYCSRCWEVDHRLIHLSLSQSGFDPVRCPQCKAHYDGERIVRLAGA